MEQFSLTQFSNFISSLPALCVAYCQHTGKMVGLRQIKTKELENLLYISAIKYFVASLHFIYIKKILYIYLFIYLTLNIKKKNPLK